MPVYPDLWGSQNKLLFLIINYGCSWIINLMLIIGVRFNKNSLLQTCRVVQFSTFQPHGIFPWVKPIWTCWKTFISLAKIFPQTRLGLLPYEHWLLMRVWHLCNGCCSTRVKLVSATSMKFCNWGGCNLNCCFVRAHLLRARNNLGKSSVIITRNCDVSGQ